MVCATGLAEEPTIGVRAAPARVADPVALPGTGWAGSDAGACGADIGGATVGASTASCADPAARS